MPNFPTDLSSLAAFAAASEAILGLTAQGKPVTAGAVREWLGVVYGVPVNVTTIPADSQLPQAMHFALRMLTGPDPA